MIDNTNTKEETIKKRIKKDEELLLSQLRKVPIIQVSCERVGVARATYYRWRKADSRFTKDADSAIREGTLLINDMAESQLLSSIRDGNMTGIIFWLKNHHPSYETRIELRQTFSKSNEKLTKRQREIIRRALKITSIDKKFKLKGVGNEKEKID